MKRSVISISLLSLVLLFFSCKKQLDLQPIDSIDPSKAFSTVDDLEKGLLGVYSANDNTTKIYIGSILADETKVSNENRGQGQFTFKWQYSSTEGEQNSDYAQYYVMIDRLHRVLAAIDGVVAANDDEANQKSRIKAELITLRGIALYELLIRFMPNGYNADAPGVPVMLQSDLTAKPARNKVGEVVAQIQADLATGRAEPLIPSAPDDVLRLSQSAIAAYQARLALLIRDWTAAANFAGEAVTLSGKSLASGDQFISYWQDANESETIWKYRNENTPQTLWRDVNGDVFFEPSDKLKDLFDRENDVRFTTFFAIDPSAGDTAVVNKYPGSAAGPEINDLKLIRVAEMYLIRAEAEAQNNQLTEAATDINALRAARIAGYTNENFSGKDEAISAISNERFKELCYEGFRFFDLKRNELAVTRLPNDVQSDAWQNLPADDYHFALPIPQDEIFANPNVVQNPGY